MNTNKLVRVILTFRNPSPCECALLSRLISVGYTISDQKIYVASPEEELRHYSDNKVDNLEILKQLSLGNSFSDLRREAK